MTWKHMSAEEKTAAIQALKVQFMSARQIAVELGTTRLAVIGHAFRNMGGIGPIPKKPKGAVVIRVKRVKAPPAAILPAPIEIETPPIKFMDRKMGRECAYILDMASLTCCGNKVKFGYEWCGKHAAIVWGGS